MAAKIDLLSLKSVDTTANTKSYHMRYDDGKGNHGYIDATIDATGEVTSLKDGTTDLSTNDSLKALVKAALVKQKHTVGAQLDADPAVVYVGRNSVVNSVSFPFSIPVYAKKVNGNLEFYVETRDPEGKVYGFEKYDATKNANTPVGGGFTAKDAVAVAQEYYLSADMKDIAAINRTDAIGKMVVKRREANDIPANVVNEIATQGFISPARAAEANAARDNAEKAGETLRNGIDRGIEAAKEIGGHGIKIAGGGLVGVYFLRRAVERIQKDGIKGIFGALAEATVGILGAAFAINSSKDLLKVEELEALYHRGTEVVATSTRDLTERARDMIAGGGALIGESSKRASQQAAQQISTTTPNF